MSLELLTVLTSLVGAVGVVASLVYLSRQIRQNTRAMRAGTYQGVVSTSIGLLESIYGDGEVARLLVKMEDGTSIADLSHEERVRAHAMMLAAFRSFDNLLYQARVGTLDPDLWPGYQAVIAQWYAIPAWAQWFESHAHQFSPQLREFVADARARAREAG